MSVFEFFVFQNGALIAGFRLVEDATRFRDSMADEYRGISFTVEDKAGRVVYQR